MTEIVRLTEDEPRGDVLCVGRRGEGEGKGAKFCSIRTIT